MRFVCLTLALLLAPGVALASRGRSRSGGRASAKSSGPAKSKGVSGKAKGAPVAGALSDSDRPAAQPGPQASSAPAPKGPQRIDFDDRLIEGQSNKSGAVYLYDRKDLQVESMVKQPSTFRQEIAKGLIE